jgi:nitrogen fixation protein FixH
MDSTLISLFGGLIAVILLFALFYKLPLQLRGLLAAGLPMLAFFVYAAGHWPGLDMISMHIAVYVSGAFVMIMLTRNRRSNQGRMHWVPKSLIVFFVLLTVLMAGFLYISVQGLPGGIAARVMPGHEGKLMRTGFSGVYEHGDEAANAINSQLSKQYHQDKLGWTVALQGLYQPSRGQNVVLVQAGDLYGTPLDGLTAVLYVKRPGESGDGKPVVMNESSKGNFASRIDLPDSGRWLVELRLTRGDERYSQDWEVSVQ